MTNSIPTNPTIQKTPKSSSAIVSIISGVLAWLGLFGWVEFWQSFSDISQKMKSKKAGGSFQGMNWQPLGLFWDTPILLSV